MIGRLLNRVGTDGLAHILVSLVLCGVLGAFLPLWAAVLATLAVGLAKELVWDWWLRRGTCDLKDVLCDAIGVLVGVLVSLPHIFI